MFELKIYKKDSSKQPTVDKKAKKTINPDTPTPPENTENEEYSFVLFYELNVGESKLWIDSINEK